MISKDPKKKTKKRRDAFLFNPHEIAFCGYSNSGKTTLIMKLIEKFKNDYRIGYLKHDAHHFEMDRKGKDTWKVRQSGASHICISDPEHSAEISSVLPSKVEMKSSMIQNDFVFVEGYKNEDIQKVVVVDSKREILQKVENNELSSVLAFVGEHDQIPELPESARYFQRDQVDEIGHFLIEHWAGKMPVLNALVLTGGKSERMKSDKALLEYRGVPQAEAMFKLLDGGLVERTFLSCRKGQWEGAFDELPQIYDSFFEMGPMGGILSAQRAYPECAWLVVACDLPFLTRETLEKLISMRNPMKFATCYDSSINELPEPLCAIYEPKSYQKNLEFVGQGFECPRKVLLNSPVKRLKLENTTALDNINYAEEFVRAKKMIDKEL